MNQTQFIFISIVYLLICCYIIHIDRKAEQYDWFWKQTQTKIQLTLTFICAGLIFLSVIIKLPYIDTGIFGPDLGIAAALYMGVGGGIALSGPISLIHIIYRHIDDKREKK